jgi:heavy metal sensor kinase
MRLTLRARLAVISTVVFGIVLAIWSVVSYHVLAVRLDADVTERLTQMAEGLHGYLHMDGDTASVTFDESDAEQATFVHDATQYFQVYDGDTGRLLTQSKGFEPLGVRLTSAEVRAWLAQPAPFDIRTDYGRFRIANSVIASPRGERRLLQVGVSLAPLDNTLDRYVELLQWYMPAALLVGGLAAWALSGLALAPLSRLAEAAAEIDVTRLDRRLPIRHVDDELDLVAGAFNETLARLDEAVGEMRQFSAALAHELRTPLTALRGEIELGLHRATTDEAGRRTAESQIEEIDRLTRLIDAILTIARAESGQIAMTATPVDLGALATSLVDQLDVIAESRAIALRCQSDGITVVDGDAAWLQRMLLNLLDNALKFTSAGGQVTLRVAGEANAVRVDVADTGIGLSDEDAGRVFERFFRADPSRSSDTAGAGLGLSLVKWIVDRHHGRIAVASQPQQGSTFTVWLPRAVSAGSGDRESLVREPRR